MTFKTTESETMFFDIKTATSSIKYFDGNSNEVESFIDSIKLLQDLTPVDQRPTLLKFLKTRITGKARLSLTDDIDTTDKLVRKIRDEYTSKVISDSVLAKLKGFKQKHKPMSEYTVEIEELSSQLPRAFVSDGVANGVSAEKLADKFAIQALIDNVTNP